MVVSVLFVIYKNMVNWTQGLPSSWVFKELLMSSYSSQQLY